MEDCDKTIIAYSKTIVYTRDGQFVAKCVKTNNSEDWYNADDKYHRDDGPAKTYYKNGQKTEEYWYRNGKCHRDDGPAVIWYKNGQKTDESWYRNGRFDGDVLAYVWLADINNHSYIYVPGRKNGTLDEFRDMVKGPLALELMGPLPIPIRDAIYEHYCLQ